MYLGSAFGQYIKFTSCEKNKNELVIRYSQHRYDASEP
jgi:hypothetical protein